VKDLRGRFVTSSEAARLLGTSSQWVRCLAKQGNLRAVRTSLGYLFDRASVEREAQRRKRQRAEGPAAE
jgi:excisionase family DNA binding protein